MAVKNLINYMNFNSFWQSPTMMTWLSYFVRALSLFVVLPMILTKFTEAEISLWYLFSSIIVLSGLVDFGFRATFTRIISYAYSGASHIGVFKGNDDLKNSSSNWLLIEKIFSSMKKIYLWLSIVIFLFMISFGTWAMAKPISLVSLNNYPWAAWGVIVLTTIIKFYGTIYQNYLEGLNRIALVRKVESLISLGLIISSIIVLFFGGKLLGLVITFQFFGLLGVLGNIFLSRKIENKKVVFFKKIDNDKEFLLEIWKPAWRSGVSGLMSIGLTNITGILYAQIGSVQLVASYLLALRIINQIKEVSMAPFYSKIPLFSRLRVEGSITELIKKAQIGMIFSNWVFILGVIFIAVFSDSIMEMIGSNVSFVSSDFWLLLSLAFFFHRYGAMHLQLYLTTNDVKSHIADGITGIIFIVTVYTLIDSLDFYAFPIGMIVSYLGFYVVYSVRLSLKNLSINFFKSELKVFLFPLLALCIFAFIFLMIKN
jgi:O-antigen/teichoic acid export membrane protein